MIASPARTDEVVFDLSSPIEADANFNWLVPGAKIKDIRPTRRAHGAFQAMWEPLFQLNLDTGELEPWLAKEITVNVTQDVWTLKLRDDVTWSDIDTKAPKKPGDTTPKRFKFTASDVVFTTKTLILENKDLTVIEASRFRAQVADVTALDQWTVQFTLKKPNPRFAIENFGGTAFGSLLIMPEHVWAPWKAADTKRAWKNFTFDKPIGTGPYVLKDYSKNKVTYALDKGWWGAKAKMKLTDGKDVKLPKPLELVWQRVETEAESLALLKKGDLDAAREYSLSLFEDARKNPKIIGWTEPSEANDGKAAWHSACTRQIDINTQPQYLASTMKMEDNPWQSKDLRKVLAQIIDRQKVADTYGGTTKPSNTMFVDYVGMADFIRAVKEDGFAVPDSPDAEAIAKAEATLVTEGYKKGKPTDFYAKDGKVLSAKIAVNQSEASDLTAAKEIERQLDAFGIDASLDIMANSQYWGWAIPEGHYQLAFGWLSCGSLAEPYSSMYRYWFDENLPPGDRRFNNTGRWDTAGALAYKKIIEKMAVLPLKDPDVQVKRHPDLIPLMSQAYFYLNDETPFIPLVQAPRIMPFNTTYWTGWPTSADPGNPAHDWGSMHLLLQKLERAQP